MYINIKLATDLFVGDSAYRHIHHIIIITTAKKEKHAENVTYNFNELNFKQLL